MEKILTICTILGGLAAIGYFTDIFGKGPEIRWVHLEYPTESGLQQNLEKKGFTVKWAAESKITKKANSSIIRIRRFFRNSIIFKVKSGSDDLVLIKIKNV